MAFRTVSKKDRAEFKKQILKEQFNLNVFNTNSASCYFHNIRLDGCVNPDKKIQSQLRKFEYGIFEKILILLLVLMMMCYMTDNNKFDKLMPSFIIILAIITVIILSIKFILHFLSKDIHEKQFINIDNHITIYRALNSNIIIDFELDKYILKEILDIEIIEHFIRYDKKFNYSNDRPISKAKLIKTSMRIESINSLNRASGEIYSVAVYITYDSIKQLIIDLNTNEFNINSYEVVLKYIEQLEKENLQLRNKLKKSKI